MRFRADCRSQHCQHDFIMAKALRFFGNTTIQLTEIEGLYEGSANTIFGKIGRIASEEVTLQLMQSKSVPLLLYGLEACPLNKSQLNSLDFVINRFFMKLFVTS